MPGRVLLFLISAVPPVCAFLAAITADVAKLWGTQENELIVGTVTFGAFWKAGVLIFGVGFTLWGVYRQHYRPFVNFRELRQVSFDEYLGQGLEKLRTSTSPHLRLNVMRAHAIQIGQWFHAGRLRTVYHNGYDIASREPYLRFLFIRIRTCIWAQGACGYSIAKGRVVTVGLEALNQTQYNHLTGITADATTDVKLVISIPVPEQRSKSLSSLKLAGVINIDTEDTSLAEKVLASEDYRKELERHLMLYRSYVGRWL